MLYPHWAGGISYRWVSSAFQPARSERRAAQSSGCRSGRGSTREISVSAQRQYAAMACRNGRAEIGYPSPGIPAVVDGTA